MCHLHWSRWHEIVRVTEVSAISTANPSGYDEMGGNNISDYSNKHRQPSSINDLLQEFLMCHSNLSGVGSTKMPEWRKYRQNILQILEELRNCKVNSSGTVALARQFRLVESTESIEKIKEKLPNFQTRGNLEIYVQHVSAIEGKCVLLETENRQFASPMSEGSKENWCCIQTSSRAKNKLIESFLKTSSAYFPDCANWTLSIVPTLDVPVSLILNLWQTKSPYFN